MYQNLGNICRICLKNGSRNIFDKSNGSLSFESLASSENVSSIDRLLEKMRFVTMLKVSEKQIKKTT